MNMGKGILIAQEKEMEIPIGGGSWGGNCSKENWEEILGFEVQGAAVQNSNEIGKFNPNGGFHDSFNHIDNSKNHIPEAESYTPNLSSESAFWDSSWSQLLEMIKAPPEESENGGLEDISVNMKVRDSHSLGESLWTPSDAASSMRLSQNHYMASNHQSSYQRLSQIPHDGQEVPYQFRYNLNSPPPSEAEPESNISNVYQFAPATPEQAKKLDRCLYSAGLEVTEDQNLNQTNTEQKTSASICNEAAERNSPENVNILDSSLSATCTTLKESNESEKGSNTNIDLNKTPPQKPPRRKKHRPKVYVEGKPKGIRKAVKSTNSERKHVVKRKYVRKNGAESKTQAQPDVLKENKDSNFETASKSCRRALNFVSENITKEKSISDQVSQKKVQHELGGYTHLQAHDTKMYGIYSNVSQIQTTPGCQWSNLMTRTEALIKTSPSQIIGQIQTNNAPVPNQAAQVTSSVVRELQKQMLNLTHNTAKEPANPSQSRLKCCYLPEHQLRNSEVYRPDFHKRTAQENLEVRRRQMLQSTTQKLQSNLSDPSQRGYKREYHLTLQHLMSTWSRQRGVLNANEHSSNRNSLNQNYSGSYKKARFENGQYKTTSATQSSTIGEEGPRHLPKNHGYRVLLNHFAQINSGRLVSYFKNNTADNINNGLDSLTRKQHVHSALAEWDTQKHCRISAVHKHPHYATMNRPIMPTPFWMMRSPDVANPELQQTLSTKASACINGQGIEAVQAATYTTMETKVQRDASETKNTSNATVSIRKQNEPHRPQKPLMHHTALQEKQKREVSVEQIICQFELLNLNATNSTMVCYEQNALVAYKGDGTMIPYESFDPIKRRKPRPKVDLDAETNRLWKLLMEREGGQDEQEMGEEKAKWWEQERKVFCGRADSFIAKMRLFQGDRRFSQWKGSVVDSVVGVFLTQNVSDHLSSSAFMSLAAHFPLQSKSKNTTTHYEGPRIFVQEPIAHILSADDSIRWHEQSTSWPTPEKTPSQHQGRQNTSFNERQEVLPEVESWTVEEVLSSQDSTESSTLQATAEAQSFSGSNLNAYCIANAWESTNTASNIHELDDFIMLSDSLRQGPGSPLFHETSGNGHEQLKSIGHPKQSRQLGAEDNLASSISVSYPFNLNNPYMQDPVVPPSSLQIPITSNSELYRIQGAGIFGQQITKPLCSSSPGVNSISDVGSANRTIRGMVKGSNALQQRGQIWPPQMPTAATYYTQHNRHPAGQKDSGLAGFQEYGNEVSNNNHQHGRTMASQSESRSTSHVHRQINTEVPVQHVHNLGGAVDHDTSVSMAANEVQTQNRMPESNPNEQFSFPSGTSSMMISNTLNVRGGKTKTEKKNTFDWDSLRKQVHSNVDKGERRVETLDSLDYEAVRCADVYEISKVIKERGMNNMLAERIKEFLNRLVQDHGSIDLEWLRNVPPDKAKDYLLSIRGLGLKSVECVRLLTLHHLAFPVDTNVGRIAVRLGWVPLQPLPESLQLHLLELYPVLESIQKYLWPRLCKLDQPTLYELHYHLITFGKVFCTKSRPNCNACPMRGECRHFASAFASARLALPGPEEKSIVPSAVLTEANRNPTIAINSIPPHCLENIAPQGTTFHSRQCEPIVEEPATPEQASTEISEIDIEDMLYEDPDEIPTIRLNVEQFNSNLHNFMQENIQLNESSLSKALVAFTPEAASVPRPKLKNVSRLRTEHQVYEIPDTHPLLEGLDKRESDDPSPYLLAIWTPGEIADSIQPPERSCGSQESRKLCSANTCFSCNSIREANLQIVRGTLLIPCRTAMRGSFPLNGTYFQVNEMFADHDSSLNPIDVPRSWIWNLTRRTVYFGTSVTTIFKGMSQDDIKYCFWRGFVCVRGFDRKTRAPRPLMARLHFPASKLVKSKRESK